MYLFLFQRNFNIFGKRKSRGKINNILFKSQQRVNNIYKKKIQLHTTIGLVRNCERLKNN